MFKTLLQFKCNFLSAGFAFVLLLVVTITVTIIPCSVAVACSGCAEHYPWMHHYSDANELKKATTAFMEEYNQSKPQNLQEAYAVTNMWYVKHKSSGSTE